MHQKFCCYYYYQIKPLGWSLQTISLSSDGMEAGLSLWLRTVSIIAIVFLVASLPAALV